MQAYSNPERETDPNALPNIEIFWADNEYLSTWKDESEWTDDERNNPDGGAGFYWIACFPGCLPDSEPFGPFATEAEALADAQDYE